MAPEERPTAAFVLLLVGGIIILIEAIILGVAAAVLGLVIVAIPGAGLVGSGVLAAIVAVAFILAILIIVAAFKVKSGEPDTVKKWSIIALVLSIIELIFGGGFYIGSILALVGAILGLVWKPKATATTAAPATGTTTATSQ